MKHRIKKIPCKLVLGCLQAWAKKSIRVYGYTSADFYRDTAGMLFDRLCHEKDIRQYKTQKALVNWGRKIDKGVRGFRA